MRVIYLRRVLYDYRGVPQCSILAPKSAKNISTSHHARHPENETNNGPVVSTVLRSSTGIPHKLQYDICREAPNDAALTPPCSQHCNQHRNQHGRQRLDLKAHRHCSMEAMETR